MQAPKSKRSLAAVIGAGAAAISLLIVPKWEGTETTTYRDIGGVLTYCTGATENAMWGKTYTLEECRAQLDRDLVRHAEGIKQCLKPSWDRLTDGQRAAFVSAAYNIGVSAFCGSSMAKRANMGDMVGACASLSLWTKVGSKEVRGLANRRADERAICEGRK